MIRMLGKVIAVFLTVLLTFLSMIRSAIPEPVSVMEEPVTNYSYVFVHGLSGWGSYDLPNTVVPYWGMLGGDLMKYLNKQGFRAYAASVAPIGSAWDRACELYAQLTGTVVDYGKEHSERCGHERYGKDYSRIPLIDKFDSRNKINLLGHSFGGATVRLFAELMANGSEAERKATDPKELSSFFEGGKGDWIYSVTSLAAPHNGTSSLTIDAKLTTETAETPKQYVEGLMTQIIPVATRDQLPDRIIEDYAQYDLSVDGALKLNESISTVPGVYYFSFACYCCSQNEDGTWSPDEKNMESLFHRSSDLMGAFTGETVGGYYLDESWQKNDGLVNTISARYPFGEPHKDFDENNIEAGMWNVFPDLYGDHMYLQGELLKTQDVKLFYVEHLNRINGIDR